MILKQIALIEEIRDNIGDTAIEHRNSTALEKRYYKEEGFLADLPFENEPEEVLKLLKKDTVIRL